MVSYEATPRVSLAQANQPVLEAEAVADDFKLTERMLAQAEPYSH